jgi:F0F1-type ATP synthase delta subunit
MTATEVIAEIDRLPREDKEAVIIHVHEMEADMIPESFLQGMAEAQRGDLLEMTDAQFENPRQ